MHRKDVTGIRENYEGEKYMKKKFRAIWINIVFSLILTVCVFSGCGQEKTDAPAVQVDAESVSEVKLEPGIEPKAPPKIAQSPEVEPEPESEPEPEPAQISLVMVGDILLHTPVEESAKQENGSYNFDAIFANTKEEIEAADLAIVNQEVIIGGEELGISGYPAFNAPFAIGDSLVDAGFDVVCHGTNHALDKGKTGLLNCLDFWEENYPDVEVLGIHDTAEDESEIFYYEQDGIRIAILNYTYSTNGVAMPEDMPFAVDMLTEQNKENILEDIRIAEEQADFTIVCPHWGTEYHLGISSFQEKWTKLFLENGVDLVLGTHPHVIEPIEMIKDEETGQEMLVYYSLGNFVNWTSSSGEGIANRMVGGMAQVTIEKDESGKTYIQEYDIEALVCHLEDGVNGVTVYPLDEYTEELASRNQIISQDHAFSLQYCEELCQNVWRNMYQSAYISK